MKQTRSSRVAETLFFLPASFLVLAPLSALAAFSGSIVPTTCGGAGQSPCGWTDLLTLGNNILQYMVYVAVPVAAIAFAYAGWLYLSSRGNPSQISKAHGIFLNVFIGLVIVLVAWLVVDQIFKALVQSGTYIQTLGNPSS